MNVKLLLNISTVVIKQNALLFLREMIMKKDKFDTLLLDTHFTLKYLNSESSTNRYPPSAHLEVSQMESYVVRILSHKGW